MSVKYSRQQALQNAKYLYRLIGDKRYASELNEYEKALYSSCLKTMQAIIDSLEKPKEPEQEAR